MKYNKSKRWIKNRLNLIFKMEYIMENVIRNKIRFYHSDMRKKT